MFTGCLLASLLFLLTFHFLLLTMFFVFCIMYFALCTWHLALGTLHFCTFALLHFCTFALLHFALCTFALLHFALCTLHLFTFRFFFTFKTALISLVGDSAQGYQFSCKVSDNTFPSFLKCEITRASTNDLKEKLREAFKKASGLIAALGSCAGTVFPETCAQTSPYFIVINRLTYRPKRSQHFNATYRNMKGK